MFRRSGFVLAVAIAMLALVRCELAFPRQTQDHRVAAGGSGTGGAGAGGTDAGGTSGAGGTGGAAGGPCFPAPGEKFCGGHSCPSVKNPAFGCAQASCAPCNLANAAADCANSGDCGIQSCNPGFSDCNSSTSDGCEVNTASDPKNCGSCGNDCFSNTSASNWDCASGNCKVSNCPVGKADCNQDSSDGCEVSVTSDPVNCAFCGNDCSSTVQHATPSCTNGKCGILKCNPGWADCDGDPSNGCEQDIASDPSHCSGCNVSCNNIDGTPACVSGNCAISCNSGRGNCDGNLANGCETNLGTTTNCGSCGVKCGTNHASPSCLNGQCSLLCESGYANCNGDASDGCEVLTAGDNNNCGSCGLSCTASVVHAIGVCMAGMCSYTGACASGWGDCDGGKSNGCETSLTLNSNCGSCNFKCGGGKQCVGGTCK